MVYSLKEEWQPCYLEEEDTGLVYKAVNFRIWQTMNIITCNEYYKTHSCSL